MNGARTNGAREVRVAAAGALPVTDAGEIMRIDVSAGGGRATLLDTRGVLLNEGRLSSNEPVAEIHACGIFGDGFESGNTSVWSNTVP